MKIKTAQVIILTKRLSNNLSITSNASYIVRDLNNMHIAIKQFVLTYDASIEKSLTQCDLTIVIGNENHISEKVTKRLCSIYNCNYQNSNEIYDALHHFYKSRSISISNRDDIFYGIPENSIPLITTTSSEYGFIYSNEAQNHIIVLLPNPSDVAASIWNSQIVDYIKQFACPDTFSLLLNLSGCGIVRATEEADRIKNEFQNIDSNAIIGCAESMIQISSKFDGTTNPEEICLQAAKSIIDGKLHKYVYGINTDLPSEAIRLLKSANKTLAVGETLTGGLMSKRITDINDIAGVCLGSLIATSDISKCHTLGISQDVINQYGIVSHQYANKMADGIRKIFASDIGLSIVGINSLDSNEENKSDNLIYISISTQNGTNVTKYTLEGESNLIKYEATQYAFRTLIDYLKK